MTKTDSKITTGKSIYAWNDYKKFDGSDSTIQAVEWPNGKGFTYIKSDDSTIDLDWEEWEELVKTVNVLKLCERE